VGKSSIINYLIHNKFEPKSHETVAMDYAKKEYDLGSQKVQVTFFFLF